MTGSGSGNSDWDIQILEARLKRLEEEVAKKRETLHGNHKEGLLTRVSILEGKMQSLLHWQGGWLETTNVDDFKHIVKRLSDLRKEVGELDKKINKYSVYAIIGIWIITIILQLFGTKLATLF